jgi:multiple sugar transport system substrate-binding protein
MSPTDAAEAGAARPRFSRRDFLAGALATGTLSAAATYLTPGGHAISSAEIRFVTGVDPTGARDLLVEMWNRANPKSTVRVNLVKGTTLDQRKAMVDLVNKGAADVLNLDVIDIPYFQEQKHLAQVEPEDVNGFLAKCLLTSQADDPGTSPTTDPETRQTAAPQPTAFWAVPFNADVGVLFQRLVADFGPKTVAPPLAQVVDQGVADGSEAFALQLQAKPSSSAEAFVVNVLEHALSRDQQILDPTTGMPTLTPQRWQEALDPLRVAVGRGRFTRAPTEDTTRQAFQDGRLSYMRNWPVKYRELQQYADVDVRASRIRVSRLPIGILGGQSLAVASNAENTDRATDFIRFMTGPPAQKILASYGLPAVRTAAYGEPAVQAFIPHLGEVQTAVEDAQPRPVSPRYHEFSDVVVKHVSAFLDEGRDLTRRFTEEMAEALGI